MSVREDVLDSVRHLKEAAEAALRLPGLSDEERLDLQRAADVLVDSAAKLLRINGQHDVLVASSPRPGSLGGLGPFVIGGDIYLSSLLWAAVTIGNLALLDPQAIRALRSLAHAREEKAEQRKTKEIDDLIAKLRAQGLSPKEIETGLIKEHKAASSGGKNPGWQPIKESAIRKRLKRLNL